MESSGRLFCVLGLLLCGAASPGLSASGVSTTKKPIIGKEEGRGPGAGTSVSACGLRRRAPASAARMCVCLTYSTRAVPEHHVDRAGI